MSKIDIKHTYSIIAFNPGIHVEKSILEIYAQKCAHGIYAYGIFVGYADEDEMLKYFGEHHGDWLALPFDDDATKRRLSNTAKAGGGIPSIVVVDNEAGNLCLFSAQKVHT